MTLRSIASLVQYGFPISTLRRWCDEGFIYAIKRDGEWHVDLAAMLRRHGLDQMADKLESEEGEK